MARVFRVECKHRGGPYNGRCCKPAGATSWGHKGHTPTPWDDGIGREPQGSKRYPGVFGFATLDQYRAWFPPDYEGSSLHAAGFALVEYEGDIVSQGNNQVLFMRTRVLARYRCDDPNQQHTTEGE
jgi:hypothetical protein